MSKNRSRFLGRVYKNVEVGDDGRLHWVPRMAPVKLEDSPGVNLDEEVGRQNWFLRVRAMFSNLRTVQPIAAPRAYSAEEILRMQVLSQKVGRLLAEQKALNARLTCIEEELAATAEAIRRVG